MFSWLVRVDFSAFGNYLSCDLVLSDLSHKTIMLGIDEYLSNGKLKSK